MSKQGSPLHQTAPEELLMQAPAPICVLRGPDHVFALVNACYQQLFPTRELLGKPIREALAELVGEEVFALLDAVLASGEPFTATEVPVMHDRSGTGTLERGFFNFIYQPITAGGRVDGVMVFGSDVTDQVRARHDANVLAEDLRKANREKDEFIAVVAHELRTPMTSILGWVRLLHMGDLDAETQDSALDALERSTKAQARIIDDLLDESRIASGKLRLDLRPLPLAPLVEGAVEMMRPAADAWNTSIVAEVTGEPLETFGDPARLGQVIANVLSNAIKFGDEGGQIEVRLARVGAFGQIEIRDHGRGITPELLPHIFERFRQGGTAEKQGGLGLGLAIARHLVELQGGTITATSAGEGKGAVFTIRLPLRTGVPLESFIDREHSRRAAALPSLSGVHALIVEDDVDNRNVIAAVMERCGATVECSTTAADALLRIARRKPDVIIADIGLPGIDGCALLERLRSDGPSAGRNTPALALTVFGRAHEQERILAAGFNALRQKPIEPADLANEVARLVSH